MSTQIKNPLGYCSRSNYHVSVDEHRWRLRQYRLTRDLPRETTQPDAFELVFVNQSLARMQKELRKHTKRSKQAYFMFRMDGTSIPAIARHFNVTTRTIERDVARVFKALQEVVYGD